MMSVGNEECELEYQPHDPFIANGLEVAFCDKLPRTWAIKLDPKDYVVTPFPPDLTAYRLIVDPTTLKICIFYGIYLVR